MLAFAFDALPFAVLGLTRVIVADDAAARGASDGARLAHVPSALGAGVAAPALVSAVDADMAVCAVPCFVLVGIMMVGWFLTVVHPFAVRTVIPWLVGQIVGVQRDAKTLFDFVVRIAEQVVLACFDASIAAFREQCLGVGVRRASAMFLQKRLDLSPRVGDGADYLIVGMLDAVVHVRVSLD